MITTQEIVDYVMDSPSNTNPAVLRSLLSEHTIDLDFRELVIKNRKTIGTTNIYVFDYYIENNEIRCGTHSIKQNEDFTAHLPMCYAVNGDRTVLYFFIRSRVGAQGEFSVSQMGEYFIQLGNIDTDYSKFTICKIKADMPNGYEIEIQDPVSDS